MRDDEKREIKMLTEKFGVNEDDVQTGAVFQKVSNAAITQKTKVNLLRKSNFVDNVQFDTPRISDTIILLEGSRADLWIVCHKRGIYSVRTAASKAG